ncbi:MAG: deoxyribose-phosphate aldolase [Bryobacteraceae bacterium]
MTQTELEQLVEEIGEQILARVDRAAMTEIVASGADRVSACHRVTRVDAGIIDHTLLRPEATRDDVVKLCREAREFAFASVCINPVWVALAASELAGSPVKVCTVVGFPLGATSTGAKVAETEIAVRVGAQEIDMVVNVGALRSGDYDTVKLDIQSVVKAAHRGGAVVKVILETALLDDHQKAVGCTLAKMAQADFVKTSTGFGPSGATAHDVALLRQVVGPEMRSIGASASVRIVQAAV